MSIYEILPALDLTPSVHAKISIGMHRVVKFKISRIPLIGLETRLGRKFLGNPNLNEITCNAVIQYSHRSQKIGSTFSSVMLTYRSVSECWPSTTMLSSLSLSVQWLYHALNVTDFITRLNNLYSVTTDMVFSRWQVKSAPNQIGLKSNRPQIKSLYYYVFFLLFHSFFSHREITCPPILLFTIVNMQS